MFLDKMNEQSDTISEYYLKKVFKEFIYNYQFIIEDYLTYEIRELEKEFYRVICNQFNKYEFVLDLISHIILKDKFIISGLNWLFIILSQNDFVSVNKSTISNLDLFIN